MQGILETKTKKLDDNKIEITVTLDSAEVQTEIDAAYKQAGKNRIPGFRPGKAPRKILENYFGGKEYFQAQATEELVQTYSPLATDEADIVPLGNADYADFDLAVEGEPFSFSYTVEVTPELELSSYDAVKIELPSAEPTDEEIQAQLDALLSYSVSTDEEGNELKPELTDAWVKETFEFENVDEFKERLAESIREQKSQDLPSLREMRSSQELASRLVGEVPEALALQTEQDNYRDLFQTLQRQHMTLDSYLEMYGFTPESFRESMHQQAHDSAAIALALDALARHEKFTVSQEEIVEEFEKSGAKDPQELYENWRKAGRLSEIRHGILRMKAAARLDEMIEVHDIGTLKTDEKKSKKSSTKKAADTKTKDAKAEKTADAEKKPAKKTTKKESDTAAKKTTSKSGKDADTKKTTTSKSNSAKVSSKNGKEEK